MKRKVNCTRLFMRCVSVAVLALGGMLVLAKPALAVPPSCNLGTGKLSGVAPDNSGCVFDDKLPTTAVESWDVQQGEPYTVTLTNVTDCANGGTDATIQVIVKSSNTGNVCLTATKTATGTYQFDLTMLETACFTYPILYCTSECSPSTGSFARRSDGECKESHLRASTFGDECSNPIEDADCTGGGTTAGEIDVFKFCDANANGILDPSELNFGLQGWQIDFTPNPNSCSGTTDSNGLIGCPNLDPDTYTVSEMVKDGFEHTATCVDGSCGTGACSVTTSTPCTSTGDCPNGETCIVPPPGTDSTQITVISDETHNIDFGNVGLSEIRGRKFSDLDGSGTYSNPPDTGLAGVKIVLSGTAANGTSVSLCAVTSSVDCPAGDTCGTYSFPNLLPGTYTVTEPSPPAGSIATTPTSCENITLTPDLGHCSVTTELSCTSDADCPLLDGTQTHETCGAPTCAGTTGTCNIGNVCLGAGGGLTLGFWSNKNGFLAMNDGPNGVTPELALLTGLCLRDAGGAAFDPGCYCKTGACPPGVTTPSCNTPFRTWLLGANATNMAYMLSAQLAAMELNVEATFVNGSAFVFAGTAPAGCTVPGLNANGFISINALMADANTELCADGSTPAGDPNRACQEFKKNALDAANNNQNFAVPCASPNQTCPSQ